MPVPPSAEPTGPASAGHRHVGKGQPVRPKSCHRIAHIAVDQRRAGDLRIRRRHAFENRDRVHVERRPGRPARRSRGSSRTPPRPRRGRSGRPDRRSRRAGRDSPASVKKVISECGGRSGSSTLPCRASSSTSFHVRGAAGSRSGRQACTCVAASIGNAHCRPLPGVARIGFADARRRKRRALGLAAGDVERREAALAGDLADMRMVDDDQVVGARQFLDRERTRNPAASACPSRSRRRSFASRSPSRRPSDRSRADGSTSCLSA